MKIEYVKDVFVLYNDKRVERLSFEDFVDNVKTIMSNCNDIKVITQEGDVVARYLRG
jgi:hypothetical protein